MKNIQSILEKVSALQEIILEKSAQLCTSEDVSLKDLATCSKIAREISDSITKYCTKSNEVMVTISASNHNENRKHSIVKNVYDIMTLEDILQEARERFKDDLHLIEHHQNPIEIINRAKAYVNKVLAEPEEEQGDESENGDEDEHFNEANKEFPSEYFNYEEQNEGEF